MEVSKIEKKYRLTHYDLVKYQVITEFVFFKKESLIDTDIDLLTLLAIDGPVELTKFCNDVVKKTFPDVLAEEFAVKSQNVRNKLGKLEKRGLIEKSDSYKKIIQIAISVPVLKTGNVLLDYKFLAVETSKA
jgi:DNA-binding MarR family transcriptional regulator